MVKKKSVKKTRKRSSKFNSELRREVQDVERWILERKKFFKKLAWVVGLIAALLIISNLYLRVKGAGL